MELNRIYRVRGNVYENLQVFNNWIQHYDCNNLTQVQKIMRENYNATYTPGDNLGDDSYIEFATPEECLAFFIKWS